MDFSAEDKASGIKFCTVVYQHPGQGISHFGEIRSPEAQNWRTACGRPPVPFTDGTCFMIHMCCCFLLQPVNGSSYSRSAMLKRGNLASLMPWRRTCRLNMYGRSFAIMETWVVESFGMTNGCISGTSYWFGYG